MKLTNEQFLETVDAVRTDLERYVAMVERAFTKNGKVDELQFKDVVYVNKVLVDFMLDKDPVALVQGLMHQDTFVREKFLSAYGYLEDEGFYINY